MNSRFFKKKNKKRLDVDEILLDSVSLQQKRFRWEHRLETNTSTLPMAILILFALGISVFFAGRSFWLEIVQRNELKEAAEKNYVKEAWQRSGRGIIYTSDLTPLVSNTSTFNLVVVPAEIPEGATEQEELIKFLKKVSGKSRIEVTTFLKNLDRYSFRPVPFLVDLSREEILAIEGEADYLTGVEIEENFKRKYSEGSIFSHILGYTGLVTIDDLEENKDYLLTDIIGKSGLEANYEKELRGVYGKTEYEISSKGSQGRQLGIVEPEAGKSVGRKCDR